MRIVKHLLAIIFLVSFNYSFSQEEISDKLKEYEKASLNKKMELFFYFFQKFETDQKDSVLYYVNDLLSEGIKNKNKDAIALANFGIGPYLLGHSLFEEAEAKLEKAKKYYHSIQNDTMLADVYNSFGNSAFLQGNIAQAELYYNKSAEHALESGDERFKMLSSFNLSRIYLNQGKVEEAKKMIQDYIDFYLTEGSMRKLAAAYGLMGQLYVDQHEHKTAIDYFTRSMESGLTAGSMPSVANGYTNLAIAEYLSGELQKSEQYFQLALAYRQKAGNKYYIAEGYYNLGDFYFGTGNLDSAIVNYSNSIQIAEESGNLQGQKDALVELSSVYGTLKLKDKQIETLKKIILIQDKLAKQQSYKEIIALKLSYINSEKEAISTGGIREDQLHNQVAKYQSIFNNWVLIVISCIAGLVLFLYFFKRASKR